jgi:hypothetical protein
MSRTSIRPTDVHVHTDPGASHSAPSSDGQPSQMSGTMPLLSVPGDQRGPMPTKRTRRRRRANGRKKPQSSCELLWLERIGLGVGLGLLGLTALGTFSTCHGEASGAPTVHTGSTRATPGQE